MWLVWLSFARAEVVDRILHVVGGRIITTSDVAFETEFDVHDRSPIPALENPAYAIEDRLIDYALVRELAGDIETFKPSNDDVRARWQQFRDDWQAAEDHGRFLQKWGLTDEGLQGFLYSRLVVERYIARNLGLSNVAGDSGAGNAERYSPWMAELRRHADIRSPQ